MKGSSQHTRNLWNNKWQTWLLDGLSAVTDRHV